MTDRTYQLRCRVCQRDFEVESMILSGLPVTADGRLLGTCNMSSDLPPHSRAEVMRSHPDELQRRANEIMLSDEVAAMRER